MAAPSHKTWMALKLSNAAALVRLIRLMYLLYVAAFGGSLRYASSNISIAVL